MIKEKIGKIRENLISISLSIILVFLSVLIFLIIFWYTYDYKVVSWNISHYEMQKDIYKVGEPLAFRTAFCKNGNYVANIQYILEDGVKYFLLERTGSTEEGCKDFIDATMITPNVLAGKYNIKGVITYKVNPLRTITYIMESNKFRIER